MNSVASRRSVKLSDLFSKHIYREWVSQKLKICSVLENYTCTHTDRAVIGTDVSRNALFQIPLSFHLHFCPSQFVCETENKVRGERYSGWDLEQRTELTSNDLKGTASRTARSKAARTWPFGCGSAAALISVQIKVLWFGGLCPPVGPH